VPAKLNRKQIENRKTARATLRQWIAERGIGQSDIASRASEILEQLGHSGPGVKADDIGQWVYEGGDAKRVPPVPKEAVCWAVLTALDQARRLPIQGREDLLDLLGYRPVPPEYARLTPRRMQQPVDPSFAFVDALTKDYSLIICSFIHSSYAPSRLRADPDSQAMLFDHYLGLKGTGRGYWTLLTTFKSELPASLRWADAPESFKRYLSALKRHILSSFPDPCVRLQASDGTNSLKDRLRFAALRTEGDETDERGFLFCNRLQKLFLCARMQVADAKAWWTNLNSVEDQVFALYFWMDGVQFWEPTNGATTVDEALCDVYARRFTERKVEAPAVAGKRTSGVVQMLTWLRKMEYGKSWAVYQLPQVSTLSDIVESIENVTADPIILEIDKESR